MSGEPRRTNSTAAAPNRTRGKSHVNNKKGYGHALLDLRKHRPRRRTGTSNVAEQRIRRR